MDEFSETQFMDLSAEHATLGALFLDPERSYNILINMHVQPEWFTDPACAKVLEAALRAIQSGAKLDSILVRDYIQDSEGQFTSGTSVTIQRWQDECVTTAHLAHYAMRVRDKWQRRSVNHNLKTTYDQLLTVKPTSEIISETRHNLSVIPGNIHEQTSTRDALQAAVAEFEIAAIKGYAGVRSRWLPFQEKFGGWPKGKLTLVSARPSQGKSTLVNNESTYTAMNGTPAAVASIEMSRQEWLVNSVCAEAGLDASRLRFGKFEPEEMRLFQETKEMFEKIPLYVNDGIHTIGSLCTFARDMAMDRGCELIVIDYLQMIRSSGKARQSRNEEVGTWSNALATLAKELPDTAIVACSQMNRGPEMQRQFKGSPAPEPELHHLRDSGSLEQDAYMVVFIFQDPEVGMQPLEDNAPTIIAVKKARGSKTGRIRLTFEKTKQRFR